MNSDDYQKLPLMSRGWLRADAAWTLASARRIGLALLIFCALPLAPNSIAVSLLWSMDNFERHAVKIGSPEEARARAYLALLGREPLARYDKVAERSQKAGLSHAIPRAEDARDWLMGGPAIQTLPHPPQNQPPGAIDYERSGAAWLAFQASARTAMGPVLSCSYLSALQAALPWKKSNDRRGACQAVGYHGLFPYTVIGMLVLLAIALFLWAIPSLWAGDSSPMRQWSKAFAAWRDDHGDLSMARRERLQISLPMGWRATRAAPKPPKRL